MLFRQYATFMGTICKCGGSRFYCSELTSAELARIAPNIVQIIPPKSKTLKVMIKIAVIFKI